MMPGYKLGLGGVVVQRLQQAITLDPREPNKVSGKAGIDEQRRSTGARMHPYHWVYDRLHEGCLVKELLGILSGERTVKRFAPIGERGDTVHGLKRTDGRLKRRMQSFVGRARVGPQGVASRHRKRVADQH